MKKRIIAFLLMLSLSVGMTLPVYAETDATVVEDNAQLTEEYMDEASTLPSDLVPLTGYEPMTLSTSPVPTEDEAYQKMIALKLSYPEGMHWTNDDYYAWKGGFFSGGYGCAGFAFMLSDAAFGDLPARWVEPVRFEDVKVGDILRVNNNTHSVIVLEVKEDYIVIAEGNYSSSIHWGRTMKSRDVEAADYMLTRYPEGWTDQPDQTDKTDQPDQTDQTDQENLIQSFVISLYDVCLGRIPDAAGLEDWTNRLLTGAETGSEVAYGFVFSDEFKNKNLCNKHYVTFLYNAMMVREPDAGGLADWIGRLESGKTREEVFNGFIGSTEFTNLCADYGIRRGDDITVPQYGTIPTGACSVCGEPDGVTVFVKRLYKVCLDRDAEPDGLDDWCGQLWTHTNSGRGVAFGFVFSPEFTGKELSNEQFVEYMYRVFFDREFDAPGKVDWLNRIADGWSREQVFDGFAGSDEFDILCKRYGIVRQ